MVFSETSKLVSISQSKIIALSQKLMAQKEMIQAAKTVNKQNKLISKVNTVNLANFITHLSVLAKQNSIEIESINPTLLGKDPDKDSYFGIQPFQISVIADYYHLLQFMQQISTLSDLALVDDFQIAQDESETKLKLRMVVNLYGKI